MVSLRSAGLFVLAFMSGALVTAFIRWPPLQSSDWAAWVQAIGSVGAILVAIWVAEEQYNRYRRDVEAREIADRTRAFNANLDRLVTIRELIKSTHHVMVEMRSRREEPGFVDTFEKRSADMSELVDLKLLLEDIRLDILPSYACAAALITLRRCISQLSAVFGSVGNANRTWSFTSDLKSIIDEAKSASRLFAEGLNEWADAGRPKAHA